VCLYIYLVVYVWNRKVVALVIAERVEAQVAAALISRACLLEQISQRRQRQLTL